MPEERFVGSGREWKTRDGEWKTRDREWKTRDGEWRRQGNEISDREGNMYFRDKEESNIFMLLLTDPQLIH